MKPIAKGATFQYFPQNQPEGRNEHFPCEVLEVLDKRRAKVRIESASVEKG